MNFGKISSGSLPGRILRLPLKLVPAGAKMPILQGRLRGRRWIAGSSTNHGFWLGTREYQQRRVFENTVTAGSIVFDVGAHVGFYTLLAAVITGPEGHVYSFEPLPRNLQFLRRHLEINHIDNVTVFAAAVAGEEGELAFAEGLGSFDGRLSPAGSLTVKAVTLDGLLRDGAVPTPDFIKMDVEGGEVQALKGARQLLERYRPTIFLATHGRDIHRDCLELLEGIGYDFRFTDGKSPAESSEVLASRRP